MIDRSGCLKWDEKGRIGIITISGEPSNIIPKPGFADLEIVKQWVDMDEIGGIIIKGEGRHFSTGADLEYLKNNVINSKLTISEFKLGRAILDYIDSLEKPVIASIDGICFGAGLEIALACHMRYCSEGTLFSFPEINHSIIPGLGGIERLIGIAGRARAMEMLLTGDVFDSEYAFNAGIVNRVIDEKSSFKYVVEMLESIIAKGDKPVKYAVRSANNCVEMDYAAAMYEECIMFAELVIDKYSDGGG